MFDAQPAVVDSDSDRSAQGGKAPAAPPRPLVPQLFTPHGKPRTVSFSPHSSAPQSTSQRGFPADVTFFDETAPTPRGVPHRPSPRLSVNPPFTTPPGSARSGNGRRRNDGGPRSVSGLPPTSPMTPAGTAAQPQAHPLRGRLHGLHGHVSPAGDPAARRSSSPSVQLGPNGQVVLSEPPRMHHLVATPPPARVVHIPAQAAASPMWSEADAEAALAAGGEEPTTTTSGGEEEAQELSSEPTRRPSASQPHTAPTKVHHVRAKPRAKQAAHRPQPAPIPVAAEPVVEGVVPEEGYVQDRSSDPSPTGQASRAVRAAQHVFPSAVCPDDVNLPQRTPLMPPAAHGVMAPQEPLVMILRGQSASEGVDDRRKRRQPSRSALLEDEAFGDIPRVREDSIAVVAVAEREDGRPGPEESRDRIVATCEVEAPPQREEEQEGSFQCFGIGWYPLQAAFLAVCAGLLFGLMLGFIGLYFQYHIYATDCAAFDVPESCQAWTHSACSWHPASGTCVFDDHETINCTALAEPACESEGVCRWNSDDSECNHVAGLSVVELTLSSSAPVVGGFIGPMLGATLLSRLHFRLTNLLFSSSLLLACLLTTVPRIVNSFPLLLVGRVFFGIGCTGIRFLVPLIAFRSCAPRTASRITALLQPSTQIGIATSAVYAYFARPTDFTSDPQTELRLHLSVVFSWVVSAAAFAFTPFIREPPLPPAHSIEITSVKKPVRPPRQVRHTITNASFFAIDGRVVLPGDGFNTSVTGTPASASKGERARVSGAPYGTANSDDSSEHLEGSSDAIMSIEEETAPLGEAGPPVWVLFLRHWRSLGVGMFLCASFILTGLSALSAFAPSYAESVYGVGPLVMPLIISAVALPSGLLAIFVRPFLPARPTMLVGTFGLTVASTLIGLPAVVAGGQQWAQVVSILGAAMYFFTSEMCVGSTVFELAVAVMPPEVRQPGSSFVNTFMSVCNLLQNSLFPVCAVAFSGGANGPQERGYGISFLIFATIGGTAFVVLFFFMHPHRDESMPQQPTDLEGGAVQEKRRLTRRQRVAATASSAQFQRPLRVSWGDERPDGSEPHNEPFAPAAWRNDLERREGYVSDRESATTPDPKSPVESKAHGRRRKADLGERRRRRQRTPLGRRESFRDERRLSSSGNEPTRHTPPKKEAPKHGA